MKKPDSRGVNPFFDEVPSVLSIAATLEPEREEILLQLRDLVLALPSTSRDCPAISTLTFSPACAQPQTGTG